MLQYHTAMYTLARKNYKTLLQEKPDLRTMLEVSLALRLRHVFIRPLLEDLYLWLCTRYAACNHHEVIKGAYNKYRDIDDEGAYLLGLIAKKYLDIIRKDASYFYTLVDHYWANTVMMGSINT